MNRVGCAGSCGAVWEGEDPAQCPWSFLELTSRRRCWNCERELGVAAKIPGTPSKYEPDPLPKDSIGALKKLPEHHQFVEKVG